MHGLLAQMRETMQPSGAAAQARKKPSSASPSAAASAFSKDKPRQLPHNQFWDPKAATNMDLSDNP